MLITLHSWQVNNIWVSTLEVHNSDFFFYQNTWKGIHERLAPPPGAFLWVFFPNSMRNFIAALASDSSIVLTNHRSSISGQYCMLRHAPYLKDLLKKQMDFSNVKRRYEEIWMYIFLTFSSYSFMISADLWIASPMIAWFTKSGLLFFSLWKQMTCGSCPWEKKKGGGGAVNAACLNFPPLSYLYRGPSFQPSVMVSQQMFSGMPKCLWFCTYDT